MRAHGLAAGGESRYKFCIVAGGDLLCRNIAQQRPATWLRNTVTRAVAHTTRRSVRAVGIELRYTFLCSDQGAKAAAL